MNVDCRRWTELADREAVGEPLSRDDAAFRREHPGRCTACAREEELWRGVEALGQPVTGGEGDADEAEVLRILARAREGDRSPPGEDEVEHVVPLFPRRRARVAGGVVALLAAAAAVALVVRGRGAASQGERVAAERAAEVDVVSGAASIDGDPASRGQRVTEGALIHAEGRICLRIEGGVRACVEPGSEARVADLSLVHRVLELRKGRVTASLAHQPDGMRFSVATPQGSATAVGTAFSVDVPGAKGAVVVRVQEGVVLVASTSGPEVRVGPGQETVMGSGRVVASSPLASDVPATDVPASPEEPRSAPVLAAPAQASPASSAPVKPAAPPSAGPSASTSARAAPGAQAQSPEPPAARPSAADVLKEAQGLRKEGRSREAVLAYERLETDFPSSPEARVSLVSLGDLLLSSGDPSGALRAFDSYLATGGAIAEEAMFGRVQSLRALGRRDDERRAIEALLAAYPASLHGDALRARQRELAGTP